MRKLSVMQLLPALDAGGVERSTLEIATALRTQGHRSLVVSAGGRLLSALAATGSEHIELAIGRKSLRSLGLIAPLRNLLRTYAPDIVHVRSRLPAWLLRFALHGLSRPPRLVSTVHGLNSPGRYSRILTRGDAVICVSQTVRAWLLHHYPSLDPTRLHVIARGVDPAEYPRGFSPDAHWKAAFAAEYPQLQGGHLLLMPARGTRLKGHTDAIDLLAELRKDGIDARLLLAGALQEGRTRYANELKAHAHMRGVDPFVALSPPRADMRELYASAALVLQLSRKPESFGRTVLEALAIGRPVLGWAHGGVGELLQELYPQGGVRLGDMSGLRSAALTLLAAPTAPPAAIPYTLAAMQDATLALYARLAG